MYEYLEGRPFERTAARLVLDVAGVGYDLHVPVGLAWPEVTGDDTLRAWTHLAVREDAHTLYGFPTREARDLFRMLLLVRGVGPAMALAVLSSLRPEDLVAAIAAEDPKPLQAVKGVGKKTASQVILDLKDRVTGLGLFAPADASAPAAAATPADGIIEDAVLALLSIGYKEKDARSGVAKAAEKVGTEDLELLVRTALRS